MKLRSTNYYFFFTNEKTEVQRIFFKKTDISQGLTIIKWLSQNTKSMASGIRLCDLQTLKIIFIAATFYNGLCQPQWQKVERREKHQGERDTTHQSLFVKRPFVFLLDWCLFAAEPALFFLPVYPIGLNISALTLGLCPFISS